MTHSLFTIVVEFKGGTYIDQVNASGPHQAMMNWLNAQSETALAAWHIERTVLAAEIKDGTTTELNGLINTWVFRRSMVTSFSWRASLPH
jgi:hypothetical protein